MKKVVAIFLMAVAMIMVFVSCDEPKHEHSYGTDWKSDETKHWHECECGEKSEVADHKFEFKQTEDGKKHYQECTVCKYKTAEAEHEYADEWSKDDEKHWHVCTVCGADVEISAHDYNDGVVTTAATCQTKEVKKYTCKKCGYEKEETGALGSHSLDSNLKCAYCGKYVVSNTTELKSVVESLKAATSITSPTVLLKSGKFEITEAITLEKAGLTIEGDGAEIVVPESSSIETVFKVNAENVTIKNLTFSLAKKMKIDIITGTGKNLKVKNNTFTGKYADKDNEVSRAICLNAGTGDYEITGNTFKNIRQPAYLEGKGTVTGNTIENTRGWVVCQNYVITFKNNKFSGWNAEDIAIISNNVADTRNYTEAKCKEIAKANNNCRVEQQILVIRIENGETISYPDTEAALKSAIEKGGKIRLKKDITLTSALEIGQSLTLDLNEKTLTTTCPITKGKGVDLEITNGTIASTITTGDDGTAALATDGSGKLTIDKLTLNVTFVDKTAAGVRDLVGIRINSQGTAEIKNSKITVESKKEENNDTSAGVGKVMGIFSYNGKGVEITGSTVEVTSVSNASSYGFYALLSGSGFTEPEIVNSLTNSTVTVTQHAVGSVSPVFAESYDTCKSVIKIGDITGERKISGSSTATAIESGDKEKYVYAVRAKNKGVIYIDNETSVGKCSASSESNVMKCFKLAIGDSNEITATGEIYVNNVKQQLVKET